MPASKPAFANAAAPGAASLGLEPDYRLYVDHLVAVLREVRRVLRPDSTLWLNLGDCYATGGGKMSGRFESGCGPRIANAIWRCSVSRSTASCRPAISSPSG